MLKHIHGLLHLISSHSAGTFSATVSTYSFIVWSLHTFLSIVWTVWLPFETCIFFYFNTLVLWRHVWIFFFGEGQGGIVFIQSSTHVGVKKCPSSVEHVWRYVHFCSRSSYRFVLHSVRGEMFPVHIYIFFHLYISLIRVFFFFFLWMGKGWILLSKFSENVFYYSFLIFF